MAARRAAKAKPEAKRPAAVKAAGPKAAGPKTRRLPEGLTLTPVFAGVPKEGLQLLAAIAERQEREFYQANKEAFRKLCAEPMQALLGELRDEAAKLHPGQTLPPAKLFRIFRDVRFGADKRPYKDHLSGLVLVTHGPAVTEGAAALYVQLGPDSFAAAGMYGLDGPQLAAYRKAVLDERKGEELQGLLAPLLAGGAVIEAREALKRVPPGVDPAHPRAELLRNKGLILTWPKLPVRLRTSPELAAWLRARMLEATPVVRWLVRNVASAA